MVFPCEKKVLSNTPSLNRDQGVKWAIFMVKSLFHDLVLLLLSSLGEVVFEQSLAGRHLDKDCHEPGIGTKIFEDRKRLDVRES